MSKLWLVVALVMGRMLGGPSRPALASTWVEIVQDKLFCLDLASDAERAELPLPLTGHTHEELNAYWERSPIDPGARWLRYIVSLEMLAYFADRSDDQRLHTDLLIEIAVLARRDQLAPPALRAQIDRCALAQMSAAAIDRDDRHRQRDILKLMAREYEGPPAGPSSEDLPLVHALRTVALSPDPETTPLLVDDALKRADALEARQPWRAARMLAEAARVLLATGDRGRAWTLTLRSAALVGDPRRQPARVAWQNFPAQYDIIKAEHGQESANKLAWAMSATFPLAAAATGALGDRELEFAVCLRLAEALTWQRRFEEGAVWWKRGRAVLIGENTRLTSMAFFRRALAASTIQSQRDEHAALCGNWLGNPEAARREYLDTFRPLVAKSHRLALTVPLADARAQLVLADQLDRRTDAFGCLAQALPDLRADIADMSFRLAQLRSFARIAPAAKFEEIRREGLDPKLSVDLERLLNYQVMPSLGLRNLWANMHAAVASAPEQNGITHDVWIALNVFFNESGPAMAGYLAGLGKANPELAVLLTPTPWSASSFQRLLRADEALVAVEPTEQGLFVWAVTRTEVVFERADLGSAAVRSLVERLRRSLLPQETSSCIEVPPFDAAAAYEIYRHTIGLVRAHLRDGTHLFWYGNGPLAAVPAGVLLDRPPPRDRITAAADLRSLGWMIDRFAISVLPDPMLLILRRGMAAHPTRRAYSFLGVAGPHSVGDDLLGIARAPSKPVNLISGAEDELVKLAASFGTDRSKLLLGADASKPAVIGELAKGAQVVAFATHGFAAGEIDGVSDPGLLLSSPAHLERPVDALLTASDLAGAKLDADLVILSACNTASSDGRPRGEAFSGLATAFVHSGANALLVSHWEVASGAAAFLSVKTVERARRQGLGLAESLRATMRALRDERSPDCPDVHAHPFYWGPFVLVGDGAVGLP